MFSTPPLFPVVLAPIAACPSLSTWKPGTTQYFIYNMAMNHFPRSLLMLSTPPVPVVYDDDLDDPSIGKCIACINLSSDIDDFGDDGDDGAIGLFETGDDFGGDDDGDNCPAPLRRGGHGVNPMPLRNNEMKVRATACAAVMVLRCLFFIFVLADPDSGRPFCCLCSLSATPPRSSSRAPPPSATVPRRWRRRPRRGLAGAARRRAALQNR